MELYPIRKGQLVGRYEQPEPEPKGDMHPKQRLHSVWWDFRGIIYWELLKPSTTVTAQIYSAQLHDCVMPSLVSVPAEEKFHCNTTAQNRMLLKWFIKL